jgi:hypothetical protein
LEAAITAYTQYYEKLLEAQQLPIYLELQPVIMQMPNLWVVFGTMATWHGESKDEGRAWIKKFASAGTCVMEAT